MALKTRESHLIETFVTLADTLVGGYDVVDLLHTLVESCAELLDASAAGILLADAEGELEVVASTNERSLLVELMQLRVSGGPCFECVTTGKPIAVPDIDQVGPRWPQFRAAAREQGFLSVQAVPLRLRAMTIGSLNLFWEQKRVLDPRDVDIAQALADVATISILQERAIRESDVARQQLQRALDSRVLIEQAKGVVSHTRNTTMEESFVLIRTYARAHQVALGDVAAEIVARTLEV
ncbi:GAF and ANTAR domain-containing protein [Leifsonia kafniensis]|uniref:GAF and ANTAR domain-containing protein n=1 Tax=Leifsonia kafniensis TaxID=475957 RepID=A0ABP7KF86_9MICO